MEDIAQNSHSIHFYFLSFVVSYVFLLALQTIFDLPRAESLQHGKKMTSLLHGYSFGPSKPSYFILLLIFSVLYKLLLSKSS